MAETFATQEVTMSQAMAEEVGARRQLRKGGEVVGITDRVYQPTDEGTIRFEDVLVTGDLSGELEYNGRRLQIVSVERFVGLEKADRGLRGPAWKGVEAELLGEPV